MIFFQLFYQAILKIEEDCAIINHVFFIMNILIKYFEKFLISCLISKLLSKFRSNLIQH